MAICKLCLEDKKLIKAHIIPEFMYKNLYNEEHRFYAFSKEDVLNGKELKPYIQIGEFDKSILCESCDNEIISSLEKYAQKILFGEKLTLDEMPKCKNYELNGYQFSECENVDYLKFKLFVLSILWRAHITMRPGFSAVDLGPHADIIREMIYENNPGDESTYPILISSFIKTDYHYSDLILEPRKMRSQNGIISYIFSIGSFQFNIFINSIGHKLPVFVDKWNLKKDNILKTIHLTDAIRDDFILKMAE